MNLAKFAALALAACVLMVPGSILARHGRGLLYDSKETTTVKGTVTEFVWTNPHVQIGIDGADAKGTRRQWLIEASATGILAERGWTRKSLRAGDSVTISFHPGLRGALTGDLIKVVFADGRQLPAGGGR
jgi:Family of unknown function (DUF6152)